MAQAPHPAYRGLVDYSALKGRSDANYDAQDADLRNAEGGGGYNATMNIIANSQNKQSPWAPYFQSLQDQGVSDVAMDTGRPHGLADNPAWHLQGDVGNLRGVGDHVPYSPLMQSTNIAKAPQPTQRTLAYEGLTQAGPQSPIYDPNEFASLLAQQQKLAGKS